jgi:tRNA (adenine57-N1/adenine58-N1)-methyltransferase catalytic subunit
MIEEGDRLLLVGNGRTYFVRAGNGNLSTDLGILDLAQLTGASPGDLITSHRGSSFTIRIPRPADFFAHARRSGAPMLPKDIGLVIGYTGMNHHDTVLDAGTGSGIAAIYFGGIAARVVTYEQRADFARLAAANISDAGLENVGVIPADVLQADGRYDVVHFDLSITPAHVEHAHALLNPGGYLACYTPFLEHLFIVLDTAQGLFEEVHAHECIEREMTRSARGTRPSTRICHTGYITISRK